MQAGREKVPAGIAHIGLGVSGNDMIRKWALTALPKTTLTSMVGRLARSPWSRRLIPWFVRHYNIDCTEAELRVSEYPSLVAFFSRGLRAGARPIAEDGVISPVDGTVSECGAIQAGTLLQAKGSTYSVAALLGGADWAERYEGGYYITIYLSPRDYHRIHAPLPGIITRWRHIPGTLYPVNAAGVKHIAGLFTKNERLVTELQTARGWYAVVKVGATIVGSIRTEYGPCYQSPRQRRRANLSAGQVTIPVERGEEIGRFEFGSTVVLLFQPGMIESLQVQLGDSVRMGQQIATLTGSSPSA